MVTTVVKTVGAGGDYATWAAWFAAGPKDCTVNVTANTGAGSTTTAIQLDATASTTAGAYVGNTLTIGSETRLITAYDTTTKIATVGSLNGSPAGFTSPPGSGVAYTVGQVIWQGQQLKQKLQQTAAVVLTSRTTSATCYYEATTAPAASWVEDPGFDGKAYRLDPNYATIEVTSGGVIAFDVGIDYFKVSKLQFLNSAASTGAIYLYKGNQPNLVIERCIFEGACNNTSARGVLYFGGSNSVLANSLVVQKATGDAAAIVILLLNGPKVYNTTIANVGGTKLTSPISTFYAAATLKNVTVMGCSAVDTGSFTHTVVKGYTDGTQTGWTTIPFDNTVFAKVASDGTHDFRLIASSPLKDAGTALTGAELTYTANDVGGRARPAGAAWDIGPWEFQGGADTTAPILGGATATATGSTSASGSVATNEGGGMLYFMVSANATETAATVKAGSTASINATGQQNVVFSGLTANTTYYPHFVQVDAAGNTSNVADGAAFTTPAVDNQVPTFPGGAVITAGTITQSTLAFSYPAASDNVGVAKYQTSKDGGTTWQDNGTGTSGQFSGLQAGTTYQIAVRALDAAGNASSVLSLSMTTQATPTTGSFKTLKLANNTGTAWAAGTAVAWEWHQARVGTQGTITYGSGVLASDQTLTATGLPPGAGFLLAAVLGANLSADSPYYQSGTAA